MYNLKWPVCNDYNIYMKTKNLFCISLYTNSNSLLTDTIIIIFQISSLQQEIQFYNTKEAMKQKRKENPTIYTNKQNKSI